MIHYFYVDFNDKGQYYRIGIETNEDRQVVENYLHNFSQDVRYHKSQEERTRKDNGSRKTPVGIICYCKHCYDKINTFTKAKSNSQADIRHLSFQEDALGQVG